MAGSDAAALVALVKALPDDAAVHARAWEQLYECPTRPQFITTPADLQAAAGAAGAVGAIEALCDSLGRHAADTDVTKRACNALHSLVKGHAANQARAAAAGAPGLLAAARGTFAGNADVVTCIDSALVCFHLTVEQRTLVVSAVLTLKYVHVLSSCFGFNIRLLFPFPSLCLLGLVFLFVWLG